jgi:L-alanine-DL-glutamate epimerase-like enolase superfamily enzyme
MLIAIAALDMAMWDALAKALGQPLVVVRLSAAPLIRSVRTSLGAVSREFGSERIVRLLMTICPTKQKGVFDVHTARV